MTPLKARLHLVALLAAIAFLALWPGDQAGAQGPGWSFWPDVNVELDGYWVGQNENVNINSNLNANDVMYDAWVQFIPPEWFVADDAAVPDGAHMGDTGDGVSMGFDNGPCNNGFGVGFRWQDATTNTANNFSYNPATDPITSPTWPGYDMVGDLERAVVQYPNFLNDMGFPAPHARYYSHGSWGDMQVAAQYLIFDPGASLPGLPSFDAGLGYPTMMMIQDPTAPPTPGDATDICTDWSRNDHFWPRSGDNPDTVANEDGYELRRNPPDWGNYNFLTVATLRPDADNDGIENDLDTCPFDPDWDDNPRHGWGPDGDGLDSACDPEWDVYNEDQDGDGYLNRGDNCPLVANGLGEDNQADNDGDGIGNPCDTEGNGPDDVDGALPDWWQDFWVEVSGDSDVDTWTDALERLAGSDPGWEMSTPEGLWRTPQTCADGLDNDLDGLPDGYDLGCDADDDGVANMFDACPDQQEDWDGFEDADGCPDNDNDMDGVDDWHEGCLDFNHDGWCDTSCMNIPEDYDSYQDWDGCPDADNDNDGFPDVTDDCPGTDWTTGDDGIPCTDDTGEINTCEDYDGMIDWDGCHDSPGDDYDGDSLGRTDAGGLPVFRDEVEAFIGTDPVAACPKWTGTPGLCPGPSCDGHDAWVPDLDVDRQADIADVLKFKPIFVAGLPCEGAPGYDRRFDFNASGCINIADVLLYKPVILTECTR